MDVYEEHLIEIISEAKDPNIVNEARSELTDQWEREARAEFGQTTEALETIGEL
jgi:hypothetical protein